MRNIIAFMIPISKHESNQEVLSKKVQKIHYL